MDFKWRETGNEGNASRDVVLDVCTAITISKVNSIARICFQAGGLIPKSLKGADWMSGKEKEVFKIKFKVQWAGNPVWNYDK